MPFATSLLEGGSFRFAVAGVPFAAATEGTTDRGGGMLATTGTRFSPATSSELLDADEEVALELVPEAAVGPMCLRVVADSDFAIDDGVGTCGLL